LTIIQQLHAEVWAFRREMEHYFPTPSPEDSLAFAFTEAGEAVKASKNYPEELDAAVIFASLAVDATLRQNPLYKRNNNKDHTVERELAQCAMMLLTAVPQDWEGWEYHTRKWNNFTLSKLSVAVSVIYNDTPDFSLYEIRDVVQAISQLIDLPTHLRSELDRMRIKHWPARDTGPASLNEVVNEHFIYTDRMERLVLPNPKDNPANYTANDAGEWVLV